jgi:signal peptidase I
MGVVVAALLAAELARTFVAQPYTVASTSMEPELEDGDRLVVNKLVYELGDPRRGDVVAFHSTGGDDGSRTLVKRVVGVAGDVVEAREGSVRVNGVAIEEPWALGDTAAFGPIQVPEETLFVLGDNREVSVDSRVFGAIAVDTVVGRIDVVIWPPSRFGGI